MSSSGSSGPPRKRLTQSLLLNFCTSTADFSLLYCNNFTAHVHCMPTCARKKYCL